MNESNIVPFQKRRRSPRVTEEMAAKIKTMVLVMKMLQHDAAAHFGINQGRVSEIVNGDRFRDVPPAPLDSIAI